MRILKVALFSAVLVFVLPSLALAGGIKFYIGPGVIHFGIHPPPPPVHFYPPPVVHVFPPPQPHFYPPQPPPPFVLGYGPGPYGGPPPHHYRAHNQGHRHQGHFANHRYGNGRHRGHDGRSHGNRSHNGRRSR